MTERCEPEDPCLGWALTLARVEELEAAIRLMCDGCESSGIAACQSCPLYPYRGA